MGLIYSEIARSGADAENLGRTTDRINELIENAKESDRKVICFVTGVPGAGKTLAGLNIATTRVLGHADEHAVFLSGNGPLVDVLREALARDQAARDKVPKKDAARKVAMPTLPGPVLITTQHLTICFPVGYLNWSLRRPFDCLQRRINRTIQINWK